MGIENPCLNYSLIHRTPLGASLYNGPRNLPCDEALVLLGVHEEAGPMRGVEKVSFHVQVSGSLFLQGIPWTWAPPASFSWMEAFSLLCLACEYDGAS